jgi:hypothetical protein
MLSCRYAVVNVVLRSLELTEGKNSATIITDRRTRSRNPTVKDRMFIRSLQHKRFDLQLSDGGHIRHKLQFHRNIR